MQLDDLVPIAHTSAAAVTAASRETDGGWGALMRLAADFPIEKLSFSDFNPAPARASVTVPAPRPIPYEQVAVFIDAAGDGPTIGLGTGH